MPLPTSAAGWDGGTATVVSHRVDRQVVVDLGVSCHCWPYLVPWFTTSYTIFDDVGGGVGGSSSYFAKNNSMHLTSISFSNDRDETDDVLLYVNWPDS